MHASTLTTYFEQYLDNNMFSSTYICHYHIIIFIYFILALGTSIRPVKDATEHIHLQIYLTSVDVIAFITE